MAVKSFITLVPVKIPPAKETKIWLYVDSGGSVVGGALCLREIKGSNPGARMETISLKDGATRVFLATLSSTEHCCF